MSSSNETTHHDSLGQQFTVVNCRIDDFLCILDMYDSFMPEPVAQGLPPADKATRHRWIQTLLKLGENYAAMREAKVIGHSVLLVNREQLDAEYIIFVGGPHRKQGIGSALTQAAIRKAQELGLKSLWLTVESDNFRAIKLYRKVGFDFCDAGLSERKMILKI